MWMKSIGMAMLAIVASEAYGACYASVDCADTMSDEEKEGWFEEHPDELGPGFQVEYYHICVATSSAQGEEADEGYYPGSGLCGIVRVRMPTFPSGWAFEDAQRPVVDENGNPVLDENGEEKTETVPCGGTAVGDPGCTLP